MIGNLLIVAALLAAVFSVIMYYRAVRGNERALSFARYSFHGMSALIIAASLFFLYIIVTHQYQYNYVYDYSSSGLSTGLLISTFYAGQEGSFMLWLLLAVVVGIFLQNYTSKKEDLEPPFMMVYSFSLVFLIAMVTPFFKSPFTYLWSEINYIDAKNINQSFLTLPFLQNYIYSDSGSHQTFIQISQTLIDALKANGIAFSDFLVKGKGLNPLLQNIWMEVHPPVLFLGFALSIVPFAFALSALIKNKYDQWIKLALPWTIAASLVLGLGLMIGGYWAYGVLGWGGFWGWDPVENASLIPWLISVALIHTMLIQKHSQNSDKTGRFAKTNLVLAILMFLLVIYSTFLTRSGILSKASVHSFSDPGEAVYVFLILFIVVFTLLSFGAVLYRRKSLSLPEGDREKFLSRETGLLYGALFIAASASVVFVGTSAPIIGTSVETSFYSKMNLPLAIIMCLLIGLSLYLRWRETNGEYFLKSLRLPLISSLLISAAFLLLPGMHPLAGNILFILFLFSIVFTIVVNVQKIYRVFRSGILTLGGHLTHIGFALFLFGVLTSSVLSTSKEINLPKGINKSVFNYELTYTGAEPFDNGDKYYFDIDVAKNNKIFTASPVMYYSGFSNEIMREPFIHNGFTQDLYFSPLGYNDNSGNDSVKAQNASYKINPSEVLTVEVSTKPFMSFVWLGVIIMSLGFVIVIFRRNRENKVLE